MRGSPICGEISRRAFHYNGALVNLVNGQWQWPRVFSVTVCSVGCNTTNFCCSFCKKDAPAPVFKSSAGLYWGSSQQRALGWLAFPWLPCLHPCNCRSERHSGRKGCAVAQCRHAALLAWSLPIVTGLPLSSWGTASLSCRPLLSSAASWAELRLLLSWFSDVSFKFLYVWTLGWQWMLLLWKTGRKTLPQPNWNLQHLSVCAIPASGHPHGKKKCFLVLRWNSMSLNLCLFPLVLSRDTAEKSLALSSFPTIITYKHW